MQHDSLSSQTFSPVLKPGVGTVRTVLTELNPLLTQGAEDTIGFNLSYEAICTEGGSSLLRITSSRFVGRSIVGGREVVEGCRGTNVRIADVRPTMRRGGSRLGDG